MDRSLRVLVVGVGHMGFSHALAYKRMDDCEIVGIVSRSIHSNSAVKHEFPDVELFEHYEIALAATHPDIVVIATYPNTHASFAIAAIQSGAHVFVEKPIGVSLEEANQVVDAAKAADRKLLVGYILQFHPSWKKFKDRASALGRPLVIRLNLNQQSSAEDWETHKSILGAGTNPLVDCGVHYVDFMCNLVGSQPIRVNGMSARLDSSLTTDNYGHLQVEFEDGSIGWYEAGWGPMMSETAYFIKDVIGPLGSVSMSAHEDDECQAESRSARVGSHVRSEKLLVHSSETDSDGHFVHPDQIESTAGEPDHDELCFLEQKFLVRAIRENLDLTDHQKNAISSLEIVLAASESARSGRTISLRRNSTEK